jgi:hypothetical protein
MGKVALLTVAAAAVLAAVPANATMRITADPGGLIISYAQRFSEARARGERVVIDGPCLSACTLVVAMVPHGQVCATPRAVLGFHAAWRPSARGRVPSPEATEAMYNMYPENIRQWIVSRGGLNTQLLFMRGRELAAVVPSCGNALAGPSRAVHPLRRRT